MVQFAKSQGNTFSGAQKARPNETKGFGLVVLCQKCNPLSNLRFYQINNNKLRKYKKMLPSLLPLRI